jgi:hypothetical protein
VRLVFSLSCALLALASFAAPAALAVPTAIPAAPQLHKALVAVPSPSATPTAVPTASPTPLPTVLTMEVSGFSGQSRLTTPLLDFRLASTSASTNTSSTITGAGAGKISFASFSVVVPLGANAAKLEQYYQNKTAFPEVDVFIPPNTRNEFKLVDIKSFVENVTNTQSSVQFTLLYGGMEIKTVATPNPLLPPRVKAPGLIPGHAP